MKPLIFFFHQRRNILIERILKNYFHYIFFNYYFYMKLRDCRTSAKRT